jgi:pimeloyl-ACP methyl ester carboxylesterase
MVRNIGHLPHEENAKLFIEILLNLLHGSPSPAAAAKAK